MKDLIYKKLIRYFVLLSPIIDIVTSYMYYHNISITVGLLVKGIVLVLSVIYLIIIDKQKRKRNFFYLFLIFILVLINIYNSYSVIKIATLSYFGYLFKYLYFLIMLLFFVRWNQNYHIKLSEFRIPIIIITITAVISILTNSAYISYQNNPYKEGFSMWYSSANELGNILCLLFPVCIYNALHNKDGIKLDFYLIPLCGASLLLLGTKVGLLGYFLIILSYLILRIIFVKFIKLDMRFFIMLSLFLIPLMFYKYLPGVYNINVSINYDSSTALLSGRNDVLKRIYEDRKDESLSSKLFGKSYYGELKEKNQIMLVEQDFIDIFFMYGYIGLLMTIIPLIYLGRKSIKKILMVYKSKKKISKKAVTICLSTSLLLLVAFISGHAILSPSVSLYLIVLIALLSNLQFNDVKSNTKTVLMSNNGNSKVLLSKYDVTVIQEKDVCKNRLFAYLRVRNQQYDYIVDNINDSVYIKTYLKYSKGLHKKIGEL